MTFGSHDDRTLLTHVNEDNEDNTTLQFQNLLSGLFEPVSNLPVENSKLEMYESNVRLS